MGWKELDTKDRWSLVTSGIQAAATVGTAFSGRTVVQVDARAIVRGGGGIHCITQQQPRAGKRTA